MKQKGFTLIELMVTIVIIAILAGIAVPQYLAYTKRAEVAELVALADIVKKKASIFYSTKGRWPDKAIDTEEDVGLDLVLGSFGVSSNNDPNCAEQCAIAHEQVGGLRGDVVIFTGVSKTYGGFPGGTANITYAPETSQAALTWRCIWDGEEDYPGAKPDGCEAYVAPSADDDAGT